MRSLRRLSMALLGLAVWLGASSSASAFTTVSVSPTSVDFGQVALGGTTVEKDISFQLNGSGYDASNFKVTLLSSSGGTTGLTATLTTSDGYHNCSSGLAPWPFDDCYASIRYKPTTTAAVWATFEFSYTFTIVSSGASSTQTVDVTAQGSGVPAQTASLNTPTPSSTLPWGSDGSVVFSIQNLRTTAVTDYQVTVKDAWNGTRASCSFTSDDVAADGGTTPPCAFPRLQPGTYSANLTRSSPYPEESSGLFQSGAFMIASQPSTADVVGFAPSGTSSETLPYGAPQMSLLWSQIQSISDYSVAVVDQSGNGVAWCPVMYGGDTSDSPGPTTLPYQMDCPFLWGTLPQGTYTLNIWRLFDNFHSPSLALQIGAPFTCTAAAASAKTIYPYLPGSPATVTVGFTASWDAPFTVTVTDSTGTEVRQADLGTVTSGTMTNWTWDATSDAGTAVPAGTYHITITGSLDGLSPSCAWTVKTALGPLTVSTPTVRPGTIYPHKTGSKAAISFHTDMAATDMLIVRNRAGKVVLRRSLGRLSRSTTHTVYWAGRTATGRILPDGRYTVKVNATADGLTTISSKARLVLSS